MKFRTSTGVLTFLCLSALVFTIGSPSDAGHRHHHARPSFFAPPQTTFFAPSPGVTTFRPAATVAPTTTFRAPRTAFFSPAFSTPPADPAFRSTFFGPSAAQPQTTFFGPTDCAGVPQQPQTTFFGPTDCAGVQQQPQTTFFGPTDCAGVQQQPQTTFFGPTDCAGGMNGFQAPPGAPPAEYPADDYNATSPRNRSLPPIPSDSEPPRTFQDENSGEDRNESQFAPRDYNRPGSQSPRDRNEPQDEQRRPDEEADRSDAFRFQAPSRNEGNTIRQRRPAPMSPPADSDQERNSRNGAEPRIPPLEHLDGKITWESTPERTRTNVRSRFSSRPVARQKADANAEWVPVPDNSRVVSRSQR